MYYTINVTDSPYLIDGSVNTNAAADLIEGALRRLPDEPLSGLGLFRTKVEAVSALRGRQRHTPEYADKVARHLLNSGYYYDADLNEAYFLIGIDVTA